MKKILCMFAAAVLALTTALAFVGCGTKPQMMKILWKFI